MGLFSRKPDTAALRRQVDLDGLTRALSYKDAKVRKDAGWALEGLFSEATEESASMMHSQLTTNDQLVPRLVAACSDDDETVRWCAVHSLGYWGAAAPEDSRVLKVLLAGLQDPDRQVRGAAAKFLGLRTESDATEALVLARAAETDARVHQALDEALEHHNRE